MRSQWLQKAQQKRKPIALQTRDHNGCRKNDKTAENNRNSPKVAETRRLSSTSLSIPSIAPPPAILALEKSWIPGVSAVCVMVKVSIKKCVLVASREVVAKDPCVWRQNFTRNLGFSDTNDKISFRLCSIVLCVLQRSRMPNIRYFTVSEHTHVYV